MKINQLRKSRRDKTNIIKKSSYLTFFERLVFSKYSEHNYN